MTKNKKVTGFLSFVISILISLSPVPLRAAEALSVKSLIKNARNNNLEIIVARKRWESAKARIPQIKSLDDPTVRVGFEKVPQGTLKFNATMPEDRLLSLSQMLPLMGNLSLKGKVALIR